jgi:hypothetical protein
MQPVSGDVVSVVPWVQPVVYPMKDEQQTHAMLQMPASMTHGVHAHAVQGASMPYAAGQLPGSVALQHGQNFSPQMQNL